jgi:hypothetical protein
MSSRYPGFGNRTDDNESKEDFVTIGTHFDPAEPTNSTSILATLGKSRKVLIEMKMILFLQVEKHRNLLIFPHRIMVMMENVFMVHSLVVLMLVITIQLDPLKVR